MRPVRVLYELCVHGEPTSHNYWRTVRDESGVDVVDSYCEGGRRVGRFVELAEISQVEGIAVPVGGLVLIEVVDA